MVAAGGVAAWYGHSLPDIRDMTVYSRPATVRFVAADGGPLASYGGLYGEPVTPGALPRHVVDALLATEDRRFRLHFGLDPVGLVRALWVNYRAGRVVQGASTLTQQLAKNVFLSPDRRIGRKIQELLLAFWLEWSFSKDQILAIYLNRVYFGAGAYGIDAAARFYYGKPASALGRYESAMLVGLLKAPARFSPLAAPARARGRAAQVLLNMVDAGMLEEASARALAARGAPLRPGAVSGAGTRYFTDWLMQDIAGYVGADAGDRVVRTTLWPAMQRAAESAVRGGLAELDGPVQAALVAMRADGAVLAMVGGRDYRASQFNRAAQARRQPGSTFKPLVYLAALEAGHSPDSIIDDSPIRIGGWRPANFDGYAGRVSLETALARSLNAAAVRLAAGVGRPRIIALAERFGLPGPIPDHPSLPLGTVEASPLAMTALYAGFAGQGLPAFPYGITDIRGRDGRLLYRRTGSGLPRAAGAGAVRALSAMLRAAIERGTGRAARLDRPAAGKTGTSQDYRDAWFIGYTADLVAGVWVGRDDAKPMAGVTGGGAPARIWRDFMAEAHRGLAARPLPSG